MNLENRKAVAIIHGLTLKQLKEVLLKVREIEQRDHANIFVNLKGLEDLGPLEMADIIREIWPPKGTAI